MENESDTVGLLDFDDNEYIIKQSLIRNKFSVEDSAGNTVLKSRQKMFKMKEEFPFKDPDGNVVFRAKAEQLMDFAGDYSLVDEESGETFAILGKKFTFFKHVWKIKHPESGEELARIESSSTLVEVLRTFSDVASLIPHSYTITSDGEKVGEIKGKFSLRDTYVLRLDQDLPVDRETVVAAAIAVDALEHN
ncbi:MAG: LURP-one-related/scramblase family protein [Candidatus Nanohaloarchaea archaeon]